MKVEFRLIDDDGRNYQGIAELRPVATVRGVDEPRVHSPARQDVNGLPGHILNLRESGFFREPRTSAEVHAELQKNYSCLFNRVQMALLRLQRRRELRKATKKIDGQDQVAYVW
jgi:hypothetical protein